MTLHKLLAPLLVLGTALAVPACAGEALVVTDSPPPPRAEVVSYRPGHVFVEGHWERRSGRWGWRDGYYVKERPGYVYTPGRWQKTRQNRHVWVEGGFRARVVRR